MKTPKEKLKEIYDEYLKDNKTYHFWGWLNNVYYKDIIENVALLITSECGFSTTSECRKAINELENPNKVVMKEKRYGGGVRKCKKCGELINGSKIHKCNKDYFANVREFITKSTEHSGYTVYIPESAKIKKSNVVIYSAELENRDENTHIITWTGSNGYGQIEIGYDINIGRYIIDTEFLSFDTFVKIIQKLQDI